MFKKEKVKTLIFEGPRMIFMAQLFRSHPLGANQKFKCITIESKFYYVYP